MTIFQTSDGYKLWQHTSGDGQVVWRDKPSGDPDWDLEFGDDKGHPIDDLGEPLEGSFVS
jgi:hypothetical protein